MRADLRICTFMVASLVLSCFSVGAQEHKGDAAGALPPGIQLHVTLKTDLSTKYSKVGDPVELDIGHALATFHGRDPQVLLGEGTLLVGKVTMVRRASKGQSAAVAVHLVEARSKDATRALNVTLVNPVLIKRQVNGSPVGSGLPGTVIPNGTDISSDDDVTVSQDPAMGDVLSSKRNFFLVKNQTELSVVIR